MCLNEIFESHALQQSARLGEDGLGDSFSFVCSLVATDHNFTAQFVVLKVCQ
jgi:hypothetical protein